MKWRVVYDSDGAGVHWEKHSAPRIVDEDGRDPFRQRGNHPGHYNQKQEEACLLGAAAPDLLAACEAVEQWFTRRGATAGLVLDLRAAIAKAKGGQ